MRLTISISLISVLSTIYSVLNLFPIGFPIVGAPGARPILITQFLAITYGYLFGPIVGTFSILLGGVIISLIYIAPPFFILNPLPPAVSSLTASLMVRKPHLALILYISIWTLYLIYPYIGPLWTFPLVTWFHIFVLVLILIFNYYKRVKRLSYDNPMVIFIISLFSTLATHLTGSLLFESMYYPAIIPSIEGFKKIWVLTTFIYPVERLVISTLATTITLPMYRILKKIYPNIIYPSETV